MTFPCIKCKIHKNMNTQIRKYTNTKCLKDPTCAISLKAWDSRISNMIFPCVKYITFTLHSHYIHTTFTLHSHYIHTTFKLHSHYIHNTFTLHSHYIYITFTLHLHYIYILTERPVVLSNAIFNNISSPRETKILYMYLIIPND